MKSGEQTTIFFIKLKSAALAMVALVNWAFVWEKPFFILVGIFCDGQSTYMWYKFANSSCWNLLMVCLALKPCLLE
jgi:hypothetical protein